MDNFTLTLYRAELTVELIKAMQTVEELQELRDSIVVNTNAK